MEQIDAPRLVELSEKAWEDEDARSELFLKISDVFLEFLLKSLPAVAIPPISGVDDDVAYTIDGLDMSGFVIEKENVNLYICTKEDVEQKASYQPKRICSGNESNAGSRRPKALIGHKEKYPHGVIQWPFKKGHLNCFP